MNIIELAKQAGLKQHQEQAPGIDGVVGSWADLEAFAFLVAAHEREECAKLIEEIEARCVAEDVDDPPLKHIVAAIRARGTT